MSRVSGGLSEAEATCERCGLAQSRTQVVMGRGPARADVMFVGEAPGREEDRLGRGFQGAAGRRFDTILETAGLSREEIWLANAVRCRPSIEGKRNRPPHAEEIAACRHWLVNDIERVQPRVVVTLGRVAFESVTGLPWDQDQRARLIPVPALNVEAFALYHPAYLIYRRDLWETYRADLAVLREALALLHIPLHEPRNEDA